MPSEAKSRILDGDGLRETRQRQAIAAALEELDMFSSAQRVHGALLEEGRRVGLSTVYRTLQALAETGHVDALRSQSGEVLYRRCGMRGHHHLHLVCRACGRAEEIPADGVEDWTVRAASAHGYTSVTHSIEVFGLCPSCSRGSVPRSAD